MNRPPIKKTCPECGGDGIADFKRDTPPERDMPCNNCNGTGEVYNYLTPEQWEAETGEKMLDSDPVWMLVIRFGREEWQINEYKDAVKAFIHNRKLLNNKVIVARPGQPKPDDSWRPE